MITQEFAEKSKVEKLVQQMYWHLNQISKKDYQVTYLDFKDLEDAEKLLDNVTPYV